MKWKIQESTQDDAIRTARIHFAFIPVTGLNCSYGKIYSTLTEISGTEPACPFTGTHRKFYKGFSALYMSLVERVGSVPGPVSPWVHMRNFSPVSEMKKRTKILVTSSGTKFEKQNKHTIAFATLKAVPLQLHCKWGAYDVENTAGNAKRRHPSRQNSSPHCSYGKIFCQLAETWGTEPARPLLRTH